MASRLAALGRHPWRALGTLGALLLAVGAVAGSTASFTTQTVNPNNTFTAGELEMNNDKAGSAILSLSNAVPGDDATGSVTISNDGTVAGENWTLTQTVGTATAGDDPKSAASAQLRDTLQLRVSTGGVDVYNGPLNAFTSASLAPIAPGASRTYDFQVTFPGTGAGADNGYMGSSVTAEYSWTATAGD